MAFGTIYSYSDNFRVNRALVLAALGGLDLVWDQSVEVGKTNAEGTEFREKFPLGKVPTLECTTEEGKPFYLAESIAIATYVSARGAAAEQLLGKTLEEKAKIQELALFSEGELVANMMDPFMMTVIMRAPYDETRYNKAIDGLQRALKALEVVASRSTGPYLFGDKLTMADVAVAGILYFGATKVVDQELLGDKTATLAWLKAVGAVPEFQKIFGDLAICEKRAPPPAASS